MCIYDWYNVSMVEYVGHDQAIATRKPGSNFLPSKTSDCCILGGGGYILSGGVWWGYVLGSGGFTLVVMGGARGYLLAGGGWW